MTVLRPNDIDGWDPDGAVLLATFQTIPSVLEGLVRVGADGRSIEPSLAESWTFDAAGPSYSFTLRDGLKFSDGAPLTAADVVFSANEWVAGPQLGSVFSDIVGANAVDDRTVTLDLARPSTFLLDFLASGVAPVVPKDYGGLARNDFYANPIGAGPFVIDTYTPGVRTVLTRNPNYYKTDGPYLDKLTIETVADASQQLARFQAGDADVVEDLDVVLAQQVPETQRQTVRPASNLNGILFNFDSPLGADLNFRKAVNFAINRQQLASVAFDDMAQPATGILPPGSIGSVGCGCDTWTYDLDAAKTALEQSAYAGETLRFIAAATPGESAEIELIRADLEEVGISIEVEQLDVQVQLERIEQGDYDLSIGGYSNVSPTAGDLFIYFYVTNFFGSGAPVEQVLTSFDEFAVSVDEAAKSDAVRTFEQWVADNVVTVPTVSTDLVVPVAERVGGLVVRPMGLYYFDELWVS
jgi:peptide/nickel transport system substrate-binding protein